MVERDSAMWKRMGDHPEYFDKTSVVGGLNKRGITTWNKLVKEEIYNDKFKEVCVVISSDWEENIFCERHLEEILQDLRKYKSENNE